MIATPSTAATLAQSVIVSSRSPITSQARPAVMNGMVAWITSTSATS